MQAMSAKPKPSDEQDSTEERVDLFIAPFQHEYSEAIADARQAAETTATPAWQNNYKANIDSHRKVIKAAVSEIENLCETIQAGDTFEDAEKDIAKATKRLAEERVRFGSWRSRAVYCYERSAERCQEIVKNVMRSASEEERENPLIQHSLAVKSQERLNAWPRAEWKDDVGAVVIQEPERK
jgi:hypothetical protein